MANIVLDYGHGGSKPGAIHADAVEKELNLLTGDEVYQALHRLYGSGGNLRVFLTRDADYDISLRGRCGLINECHRQLSVGLAISIHYNAASSVNAQGFEVFYAEASDSGAAAAKTIVEAVKHTGLMNIRGMGYKTTAQLGRRLAFIHNTMPPAILIEVGFITNSDDREKALDPDFRRNIGETIASGIGKYLNL